MATLWITLGLVPRGIAVTWRLSGVALAAGELLCEIPLSIAGAQTLRLDGVILAKDDSGRLALTAGVSQNGEGEEAWTWKVGRPTHGRIDVSYLAAPVITQPQPAIPPLELRSESGGLSGALRSFLVFPTGPEELRFELAWDRDTDDRDNWMAVSSLGEGFGDNGELAGTGLEQLGDTYVMCGNLAKNHYRDGRLSIWWLTSPGIDVEAFATRLGSTYQLMSRAFHAPAHPYRVFLRTAAHRGVSASAHPGSFVMALNPADPLDEAALHRIISHELVHEWLDLDGPPEDVTWFVEGSADYYSQILPLRAGMIDEDSFLDFINFKAREGYASPRRNSPMREASRLFFSDFLAHRLPYVRGMFYLADLDARLKLATDGQHGVDDVVREVVKCRRGEERIGIERWCSRVEELSSVEEMPVLEAFVFTGHGRPGEGCFGDRFTMQQVEVPVLDVGFDPSTWLTRRVQGLVPGGQAECAGLREAETIDLPRYAEIARKNVGDDLSIGVTRNGAPTRLTIPLTGETALVPQWSKQPTTAS